MYTLEAFGYLAAYEGLPERAVRLVSAAEALRLSLGMTTLKHGLPGHAAYENAVHAALDKAAYRRAWDEGQSLAWEEAVAYALGEIPETGVKSRYSTVL